MVCSAECYELLCTLPEEHDGQHYDSLWDLEFEDEERTK